MFHLLKVTALNLPRCTRAVGVLLALGLAVVYGWSATHAALPGYLATLLVLACAGEGLAGAALLVGARRAGWALAMVVAAGCMVGYVLSRTGGLPGIAAGWHDPLGTLALLLGAALLLVCLSLVTGRSVDVVGARDWETYFSVSEGAEKSEVEVNR